jgi:hypothetical protein
VPIVKERVITGAQGVAVMVEKAVLFVMDQDEKHAQTAMEQVVLIGQ